MKRMLIVTALVICFAAAASSPASASTENWYGSSIQVWPAWTNGTVVLNLSAYYGDYTPDTPVLDICYTTGTSEVPSSSNHVVDYTFEFIAPNTYHLSRDVQVQFYGEDGLKYVTAAFAVYEGIDVGHQVYLSDPSGIFLASTMLDTHPPTTRAPYSASCKRGGYAALRYRVIDNLSPSADVTIRIHKVLSGGSRLVKTLRLGKHRTGKMQTYIYRCTLPQGKYRFTVGAADLAGNETIKPAANTLTVR